MNDFLVLIVEALAAYRLTRLITHDYLLQRPREALIRYGYKRAGHEPKAGTVYAPGAWERQVSEDDAPPLLAYWPTCPHCSGLSISAFVVGLGALFVTDWGAATTIAVAFAVAALVGIIATHYDE